MTDDDVRNARRLCFFAHYHPAAIVADYVLVYLRALAEAGFTVVVLSTADLPEAERVKLKAACATLIERENVGLDFGGWIDAFRRFSPIEAELLLLANDSVYGPLHDLGSFIDRLTAVPADFYGAVESRETGPHLQSWFLLLRPTAYRSAAFADLMTNPVPADMPKSEIIERYELALMSRLNAAGLRHHAAYTPDFGGAIGRELAYNPAHLLWKSLVGRYGVPFLKIELLRDNPLQIGGVAGWRRLVSHHAPSQLPKIEADLVARQARPTKRFGKRLSRLIHNDLIAYRPELQWLVARDAVSGDRSDDGRRLWLFRRLARYGTAVRRSVRRVRDMIR